MSHWRPFGTSLLCKIGDCGGIKTRREKNTIVEVKECSESLKRALSPRQQKVKKMGKYKK